VSVARLDGDAVVYDAADGRGADGITGVRLPTSRGIAGYVARTGQSLVVDQVQADPRFARDVAERVGYVPTSLLVVPITDRDDSVLGVLSVLDRGDGAGDALEVASAAARAVAPVLAVDTALTRLGPVLLRALADAVANDDTQLATSLRRAAMHVTADDDDVLAISSLLADVRRLPHSKQEAIARIIREAIDLAAPRRRW
jgi:GAF domain-containing protein